MDIEQTGERLSVDCPSCGVQLGVPDVPPGSCLSCPECNARFILGVVGGTSCVAKTRHLPFPRLLPPYHAAFHPWYAAVAVSVVAGVAEAACSFRWDMPFAYVSAAFYVLVGVPPAYFLYWVTCGMVKRFSQSSANPRLATLTGLGFWCAGCALSLVTFGNPLWVHNRPFPMASLVTYLGHDQFGVVLLIAFKWGALLLLLVTLIPALLTLAQHPVSALRAGAYALRECLMVPFRLLLIFVRPRSAGRILRRNWLAVVGDLMIVHFAILAIAIQYDALPTQWPIAHDEMSGVTPPATDVVRSKDNSSLDTSAEPIVAVVSETVSMEPSVVEPSVMEPTVTETEEERLASPGTPVVEMEKLESQNDKPDVGETSAPVIDPATLTFAAALEQGLIDFAPIANVQTKTSGSGWVRTVSYNFVTKLRTDGSDAWEPEKTYRLGEKEMRVRKGAVIRVIGNLHLLDAKLSDGDHWMWDGRAWSLKETIAGSQ